MGARISIDTEADYVRFLREHTSDLLRTAYLLTGNGVQAEELVQDTMVRLYPKWQLVQDADVPLAYVRRSLANGFVNHARRAARREVSVDIVPEQPVDFDITAQTDDRSELWQLLATLGERQRAALVLRYFHDLPDDDIAAALKCRIGTVRSLISRGLAALRDQAGTAHAGRSTA